MRIFTQFSPELEQIWNGAYSENRLRLPFLTYAWHRVWHETLGRDEQLLIITGADGRTVIPLAVRRGAAHFTGGEESTDYLDAIGGGVEKVSLWQQAIAALAEKSVTGLLLRNIPGGSETLAFFEGLGIRAEKEDTTPVVGLPETFAGYVSGLDRKARHELRRKLRRFEDGHAGLSLDEFRGRQADIGLLLELMGGHPDKRTFLTPEMTRYFRRLPETVGDDLIQLTLRIGKVQAATLLAFRSGEELLLYNSGFDAAYPGAGFYLKVRAVGWAIANSFRRFNFLQGSERYKYELGGKDEPVYRIDTALPRAVRGSD